MLDYQDFVDKPMAAHSGMLGLFVNSLRSGLRSRSSGADGNEMYSIIEGVAVVPINGMLTKRSSWGTTYSAIKQTVAHAVNNPNISGIVLNADSMGGECSGLFECADYVYSQRGSKPIYSLCDPSFSGAYVIASAADKVYISVAGGVGSLGIAFAHVDASRAAEQAGIRVTLVHSGQRKIWGNGHEPLAPGARNEMQAEADRLRGMLCDTVGRNRSVPASRIAATEAGNYFGPGAVPLLCDKVGSLDDVVADVLAVCGVAARSARYSQVARMQNRINSLRATGPQLPRTSSIQENRERLRRMREVN